MLSGSEVHWSHRAIAHRAYSYWQTFYITVLGLVREWDPLTTLHNIVTNPFHTMGRVYYFRPLPRASVHNLWLDILMPQLDIFTHCNFTK